ncbi:ATP-binding cassette domain-containing protein [Serratia marcescens]|nr:ATP-binding cassette domain-containing protein [Serratia marcescens]
MRRRWPPAAFGLLAHPEIRWGGRSTIASAPQGGAAAERSRLPAGRTLVAAGRQSGRRTGEWLAIVGASGSGKSTLLRLIARYSEPDSGTVSLDGVLADAFSAQAFNQMVAVVPQENTPPAMSLRDNLTLFVDGADDAQLRRVLAALGLAARLQDRLDDTPSLSGGEAQCLAIARALLARRPLLLADEPTSAQDQQNRERILTALAQLPATRLVATHDAELCRRADRVAVLAEGGCWRSARPPRWRIIRHCWRRWPSARRRTMKFELVKAFPALLLMALAAALDGVCALLLAAAVANWQQNPGHWLGLLALATPLCWRCSMRRPPAVSSPAAR